MYIVNIRHNHVKAAGYVVNRPYGRTHYTFAHYTTAVQLQCGEERFTTQPGACIIFTPGVSQWLYSEQDLIHDWLHLDPTVEPMLKEYAIPLNQPFYPKDTARISQLFSCIHLEFFSTAPFREAMLDSYVREFLILLHRSLLNPNVTAFADSNPEARVRAARRIILTEPERKWTLEDMAALVPLSPSRFHTIYKSLFETTPTRELILRRIALAQELLRSDEELTLSQIAELLGYREQYHFIRQFKSITGQTPGKYRKMSHK